MPLLFAWLLQKTCPQSALTQQEILKTLYYEKNKILLSFANYPGI